MRVHYHHFVPVLALLAGAACNGRGQSGFNAGSTAQGVGGGNDNTTLDPVRGRRWVALDAPTESVIRGGPWTLEQVGASSAAPSAGYCASGVQQGNPGTERMQPYYFPLVLGRGARLQGYFDWRPKDIDEAVVAAWSDDFGHSWTFQQQALELTTQCPASDAATNGGDDGQGHPMVITVGGVTRLYTLDRSVGNVDSAGLVVHEIPGTDPSPLGDTPAAADAPVRTAGLLSPDGILGVVPGSSPTTVLYLQKQLDGDKTLPAEQQCPGTKANHDVTTLRLATTDDGVAFTDLGPVSGLNDSTDVTAGGTRWVGPRGTILAYANGRFGLFFSGGGCIDNDSDALHYIGYAESDDLQNWTVQNGMSAPIVTIAANNPSGAAAPVVGTQGWFEGRVYGPNATLVDDHTIVMTFAGYHRQKPKDSATDYRTVGHVTLATFRPIAAGSSDGP
jgi:hypothetical protein